MRKGLLTICFLLAVVVVQARGISGINIKSSGGQILVFLDGEQICVPTETCFIANYSGRHQIEVYSVRFSGRGERGDLLYKEWVTAPGTRIKDIYIQHSDRPEIDAQQPDCSRRDVMTPSAFDHFLKSMKNASFDSNRTKQIEASVLTTSFTSEQCLKLFKTYNFDSEKIKFLKIIYSRIVDKQNFFIVLDQLDFNSSKNEMNEFVKNYHSRRN